MITRIFKKDDFALCVNLYIKVFNQEPWNDRWSFDKASSYLDDMVHTPGFEGFIMEVHGIVIGFIFGHRKQWWEGDIFFIHEMCVDQEVQGNGYGSLLMDYTKEYLILNSYAAISLLTERTFPAAMFYLKQGLKESDLTRLYNYVL